MSRAGCKRLRAFSYTTWVTSPIPLAVVARHIGSSQGDRTMFKRLCIIALSAASLTSLSACIVAPARPGYVHDRDADGVPNRYDRDRDNDGVRNRYDRRPGDPYQR
jgi:hypothetical protein